jgi:hypothetical protein
MTMSDLNEFEVNKSTNIKLIDVDSKKSGMQKNSIDSSSSANDNNNYNASGSRSVTHNTTPERRVEVHNYRDVNQRMSGVNNTLNPNIVVTSEDILMNNQIRGSDGQLYFVVDTIANSSVGERALNTPTPSSVYSNQLYNNRYIPSAPLPSAPLPSGLSTPSSSLYNNELYNTYPPVAPIPSALTTPSTNHSPLFSQEELFYPTDNNQTNNHTNNQTSDQINYYQTDNKSTASVSNTSVRSNNVIHNTATYYNSASGANFNSSNLSQNTNKATVGLNGSNERM